jgi:hypothetical protein
MTNLIDLGEPHYRLNVPGIGGAEHSISTIGTEGVTFEWPPP